MNFKSSIEALNIIFAPIIPQTGSGLPFQTSRRLKWLDCFNLQQVAVNYRTVDFKSVC